MMKKCIALGIVIGLLLMGCESEPEIVDTGQPGTIRVVVFADANRNDIYDEGEGVPNQLVGISQDLSCPAGNIETVTKLNTDVNGEAYFEGLEPGKYCVMYMGSGKATTKLTHEIYLSSEQVLPVGFGILGN
jgi:hypothetical protein